MNILAKSNPSYSLKDHIYDALKIHQMLQQSFPNISNDFNETEFWELLKLSIIFHDLGKGHNEFQKLLRGKANNWKYQRHELFSLPFVKCLNNDFIYYTVAGHHKDFQKLITNLQSYGLEEDYGLDLEGTEEVLTFEEEFKQNVPIEKIIELLKEFNVNINNCIVHNPKRYLEKYELKDKIKLILLSGAFKHCDHLASAGIKKIYNLETSDFDFLFSTIFNLYTHQLEASNIIGNTILTAPTGSGKTETSLLWLQNQIKTKGKGRVFYILPFTASINAMYERLSQNIPDKVGLIHGKLAAFIDSKFDNDDLIDEQKKKEIREQFKNIITPLKIVTPFQLLKNIFALKGFEKGIFEWTNGYFIFDEIHAYNPTVFAQIITLLKFVTINLNVKILVMTATLPEFLRKEIESVLVNFNRITASRQFYNEFSRHRIKIKEGELDENLNLIQEQLNRGKKVLVVCNTVNQAQDVFNNLLSENKVLLHSAFNSIDRNLKEKELFSDKVNLLVGTQAIEVSLDLDFDEIYTEPAPLDALFQRFGRVNRKREKGICDCTVFKERNKSDKFIYKNSDVIIRTIEILQEKERLNSGIIKESELQKMIDFVYPSWDQEDKEEFDKISTLLNNFIENDMKPFVYNQKQEEDFYKQFDGIKVLPIRYIDEYRKLLRQNKFIKAENLKVHISEKRFFTLINKNEIEIEREVFESLKTFKLLEQKVLVINKKYDSELGLLVNKDENLTFNDEQFL